jgi:multiple sugar transport system permease protein
MTSSQAGRIGTVTRFMLLGAALVITLLPIYWVVVGAFKPNSELVRGVGAWWPQDPTLDNFEQLFSELDFGRFLTNSLIVALAAVAGNIVFCSLFAYALAKIDFAGKRALFVVVIGALLVPVVSLLIPQFVIAANLGLVNTLAGMAVPFLVTPLGVFIMRQFMSGIPDELIEAARLDGANEFRIFLRVVLPLCGPGLVSMTILTFLAIWNGFLWPLVIAQTQDNYTLPVALSAFALGSSAIDYGVLLSGALVVMAPVLVLFFVLQRYFIQGVAATGLR